MDARLNLFENAVAMKFVKHIVSAAGAISESTLPAATQELVKLRASQINGCGVCTDMHTKDAAHAGESQLRLNLVAVWREATVFTEAERAALELTEQGTRIADAAVGVTDEVWANAARHYNEEELGALVALTLAIMDLDAVTRADTPIIAIFEHYWGHNVTAAFMATVTVSILSCGMASNVQITIGVIILSVLLVTVLYQGKISSVLLHNNRAFRSGDAGRRCCF